jgi:hypothetical protein
MSLQAEKLEHIRLEWSNTCDLSNILYQTGFINQIYLLADVGKPSYNLTEEGDNNGDNEFVKSFQKWEKTHKIELLVPEFILETLSLIPLHDQITIFLQNGTGARVKDMTISEPAWQTAGCFANVIIEFTIDYIIKTKCCNNQILI